ncbi:BNR-4 repeat-containing protein [Microbacterium sp. GXF0217]
MHRRIAIGALAGAVLATAGVLPAVAAPPQKIVEDLPFRVDSSNQAGWWNPIDEVGGVAYFAYNAPGPTAATHEVHLAARSQDGAWTDGCLQDAAGACVSFVDDNGHNQPSIVVDGAGTIHAFVSMHNEQWNYFRSETPGDVTSLVDATAEMPDQTATNTYPITAHGADGDAWLLVRSGADAQRRRDGVLYHYDPDVGAWRRATTIAGAAGYSFYPDDLQVDQDGRVHVLWEWGPWPADPARHLGSYAVYDPAAGTIEDVAGETIAGPVTPDSGGAVIWRDFGVDEDISSYTPALQTAKMALRDDRLVGITYRFIEKDATAYDVLHASWDGDAWSSEMLVDVSELGADTATSATIDMTAHGSTVRVYAAVTAQVCGELRSQAVRIERSAGQDGWTYSPIGEQRSGQQRLRATTTNAGTDLLYLSAPNANPARLSYAEVPRLAPLRQSGELADIVAALRGDLGGVNIAQGASVVASSQLRADTGPERAVDGVCTDASRWISAAGDLAPTVEITWPEAQALDEVRVRSGYSVDPGTAAVLRGFTVLVHTADGWTDVGSYAANTDRLVRVDAGGLIADAVRLEISDPSASETDVARVFEIEAIAATR